MRSATIAALGLLATLMAAGPSPAHEGHDHEAPPAPVAGPAAVRAQAASEAFELVAVVRDGGLDLWLDDFATNAPVEGATVEIETPDGPRPARGQAGRAYRLEMPSLAAPGRHDLIVTVTSGEATDILPLSLNVPASAASSESPPAPSVRERVLGIVQPRVIGAGAGGMLLGLGLAALLRRRPAAAVLALLAALAAAVSAHAHEGHDHAEAAPAPVGAGGRAQRLADGSVFVPKPVQRIFAVRTAVTRAGTHRRSVELPGRIIPDPNASGYVQAAVGGRLSPPEGGFPRLGAAVRAGQVVAQVTPPLQAIDVSDMRQRQGELDQQIAIVQRRLGRQEQLAPSGAVARSQLEETRLELQGLRERRAALDRVRHEPEALVAPVSGVIAEGTPVAGQIAQPNSVVFHIVDPARLWVEALSFDPVAPDAGAAAATAAGKVLPLSWRGAGLAGRNQTIPVHFAVESATGGLRAGQFVTVLVTTEERKDGIAVPRGALVRSANGQDFVYEHVAAERFAARPVRVEPLDGERVLVLSGLEDGRRVVVQGAELIDHVR